jgi:hypothetical protein
MHVNIMNRITRAWEEGIPTGIQYVDFAKAFDSFEHEMIGSVMEFFGYGNRMKMMVMTLLNDRKARIKLEDGYLGRIRIERGTSQGHQSSQYIFILCIEILLIKTRLMDRRQIDDSGLFVDIIGRTRNETEPLTGEAYADDLPIIFHTGERGVQVILEPLEAFGMTSGLVIKILIKHN